MTNPDVEVAARAKEDFTQCCAWLRHFSSMWPAASAHKLFFEAGKCRPTRNPNIMAHLRGGLTRALVIQGGLKLADPEAGNEDRASPLRHMASLPSPSLTGGLQAVRRHLSVSNSTNTGPVFAGTDPPLAGASGMLQIPHFFWNHLSTANTINGNNLSNPGNGFTGQGIAWDDLFNFEDSTVETTTGERDAWGFQASGQGHGGGDGMYYDSHQYHQQAPTPAWSVPISMGTSYPPAPISQGEGTPGNPRSDQASISAALMSFMADMTKPNQ